MDRVGGASHLFEPNSNQSCSLPTPIKTGGQSSLKRYLVTNPRAAPPSIKELQYAAEMRLKAFHKGEEITARVLLGDIAKPFDKRRNGSLMKYLAARGLVERIGYTNRDQEGRNKGIATLWVVR